MVGNTVQRALRQWTPTHYTKFGSQRLRPALDLLQMVQVPSSATRVVDLGCGPGNVTPFLQEPFPDAVIECVDASESMLAAAKESHQGCPDIEYTLANFESFEPTEPVDVIYSNAALHWVSFDVHRTLLPRLLSFLKPGGVLAFQMPDTRKQPSHVLMGKAALDLGLDVSSVRWVTNEVDSDAYYKLLSPLATDIHLWSTNYTYILPTTTSNVHPVVDFVSSTGLAPYVDALSADDRPRYMEKYSELIAQAYPTQDDGVVLAPYNRFFCVVTK
ncbi:unnamed protein product [Aphanomyces euteiches]|uniref:Methyltransferase domain-containing protein n=1 Tax=Aphanomyces euteiches TaxID=100861 RepID=A0A6G0XMS3_9STRA|nr:hypothetical protein Ae201684_003130 [Aphanomyces euteiches]